MVEARLREFQRHVWDHTEDAFQASFDLRAPLPTQDVADLCKLIDLMSDGASDEVLSDQLGAQLKRRPSLIFTVVQLLGLTREKLRTDVKPALAAAGVRTPTKVDRFASREDVWGIAGPYLALRLRNVMTNLLGSDSKQIPSALEALNQATWPGYIRQERAKRSGGEAEQRLAILLRKLSLPFAPEAKADNGLTKDANFAGQSFDLIVPNIVEPRLCIISMVHAANIGQYGESKATDARDAKQALKKVVDPPKLGVLADGVGFDSNRAGLEGLLTHADEFFQFETLWKAAVVAAAVTQAHVVLVLPDQDQHRDFLDRYRGAVSVRSSTDDKPGWTVAGEAVIRRR